MLRAIRLRGNLGNHLFQYAMMRGLGEEQVAVDDTRRSARSLQQFLRPGSVRTLSSREALSLGLPPRVKGRRHLERLFRNPHAFAERTPGLYDPAVADAQAPVLYSGYFQHERYFANTADEIAAAFADQPQEARDFSRMIPDDRPTVAVAIRAGADYKQLGWAIDPAWYRHAAELVVEQTGSARFIVTSDVPQAAHDTVALLGSLGPGISAATYNPAAQLHILAGCDHAIIAPSSFAWWAAWLGDQRDDHDRIVVAPRPWVHRAFDETPSGRWTRLDTHQDAPSATAADIAELTSTPP